jgi:hypothetical protein
LLAYVLESGNTTDITYNGNAFLGTDIYMVDLSWVSAYVA